ncbi:hypothetical protein ACP70R_043232 [Stipagrostis hirtigluma subsp. patula]
MQSVLRSAARREAGAWCRHGRCVCAAAVEAERQKTLAMVRREVRAELRSYHISVMLGLGISLLYAHYRLHQKKKAVDKEIQALLDARRA